MPCAYFSWIYCSFTEKGWVTAVYAASNLYQRVLQEQNIDQWSNGPPPAKTNCTAEGARCKPATGKSPSLCKRVFDHNHNVHYHLGVFNVLGIEGNRREINFPAPEHPIVVPVCVYMKYVYEGSLLLQPPASRPTETTTIISQPNASCLTSYKPC